MTHPPVDHTARIEGPYGTVQHVDHPDRNEDGLNAATRAALDLSLGTWLITAPRYHPMWSQYVLSVVKLDEHPDLPEATKNFPEASHEILLLALDPGKGLQTVDTVRDHCRTGKLPFLTPVNIAEQVAARDDEVRTIAWLACRAVVHGLLTPETADAPELVRLTWHQAVAETLEHLRAPGDPHECNHTH